jgi:ferrochelatase
MKQAVIFTNIGTPKSPSVEDVADYLNEFLMDPGIISLPYFLRWILVKKIIVPNRAPKSAANYKKVWMPEGSPLLVYSRKFLNEAQKHLSGQADCYLAMNFGSPSFEEVIKQVQAANYEKVLLVPLFPQYAKATTKSTIDAFTNKMKKMKADFKLEIFDEFFEQSFYWDSVAQLISEYKVSDFDYLVFSYHGLPVSQIKENPECRMESSCCFSNNKCYRSHCFKTTKLIQKKLAVSDEKVITCFQSRLGRTEWLRPYATDVIQELAQKGAQKILVVSPAFVADCLETLEEIKIGLKEDFISYGGSELQFVSCLNDFDPWVQGLCRQVTAKITSSSSGLQVDLGSLN